MIILDGLRLGWLGQGKLVHVLNGRHEGRKTVLFSVCNLSGERHPVKPIDGSRHLVNATCKGCLQVQLGATFRDVNQKIVELRTHGPAPDQDLLDIAEKRFKVAKKAIAARYKARREKKKIEAGSS